MAAVEHERQESAGEDDGLSLAELYRTHPIYSRFPLATEVSGSLPVEFVQIRPGDYEVTDPALHEFVLGLSLGELESAFEVDYGEGVRRDRVVPDFLYVHQTTTQATYRLSAPTELLFVSAPLDALARQLDVERAVLDHALEPLHEGFAHDETTRQIALSMWSSAATGSILGSLYVDQALLTVALRMIGLGRGPDFQLPQLSEGRKQLSALLGNADRSTDPRLTRAVDYIESHLGEPLSIAELAAVATMSPSHFARSFKAGHGEAVWAFVQRRRCERAAEMLRRTTLSIAYVAQACGFSTQSHLTRAIRQRFGTTPAAIRRC